LFDLCVGRHLFNRVFAFYEVILPQTHEIVKMKLNARLDLASPLKSLSSYGFDYSDQVFITRRCLRQMAKLEITIKNKSNGIVVAQEEFEISTETAQVFIAKMETLVADLPGHHQIRRLVNAEGGTVVEIEYNRQLPPVVRPTFQELFNQSGGNDVKKTKTSEAPSRHSPHDSGQPNSPPQTSFASAPDASD
jgi:hypothetical protein